MRCKALRSCHDSYRDCILPPAALFSLALAQRKWGKRKAAFLRVGFPGNHRTALCAACFLGTWEGFYLCSIPALPRDANRVSVSARFAAMPAFCKPLAVCRRMNPSPHSMRKRLWRHNEFSSLRLEHGAAVQQKTRVFSAKFDDRAGPAPSGVLCSIGLYPSAV